MLIMVVVIHTQKENKIHIIVVQMKIKLLEEKHLKYVKNVLEKKKKTMYLMQVMVVVKHIQKEDQIMTFVI